MTDHHLPSTSYTASTALAQLNHMAPAYDWAALVLGAHASSVARQGVAGGDAALDWGYASIAQRCLRHTVINDGDVEQAIGVVEDAIMPLARPWPHPVHASTLACVCDAVLQWLPHLAAEAGDGVAELAAWRLYPTGAVEALFNRFADVAMGGPARGLVLSAQAVASLVIVRECLHHWGMQTLALPVAQPAAD